MNETIKVLKARRSIRAYNSKPIPEEVLSEIVEAGTYAPTGRNMQSPIILAVTDKTVRDRLSKENAKVIGAETDPFYGAPAVLVVLAEKCNTSVYDGSCVMDNLMNAAWSLGVGSCWIHRAKEVMEGAYGRELLSSLGLDPDKYEGIGNCILGYFDGNPPETKPRKQGYVYKI